MEKFPFCYSKYPDCECVEACPGPMTKLVEDGVGGEGYYVQLCRDPNTIGEAPGGVNYCGDGPDVLVFHQTEFPSDDEVYRATEIL